ncbi:hypothetical protein WJX81_007234 [Elliptochloris bilobata]|uniref:J domain-containing protein n=1 Tax=Elliptochloris bilobata TaxID=381761 RepID=A0AAW1S8H0_9CHLO
MLEDSRDRSCNLQTVPGLEEYDSEQERLLARCAELARNQEVQRQARRQLEELREHQDRVAQLLAQGRAGQWEDDHQKPHRFHEPGGGKYGGLCLSAREAEAWQHHERRWQAVDTQPVSHKLLDADIPWPPPAPPGATLLAAMAAAAISQPDAGSGAGASAQALTPDPVALRRAFHRAALRWHPDRFGQRILPRLPVHEREAAAVRVAALARQVLEEWAALVPTKEHAV